MKNRREDRIRAKTLLHREDAQRPKRCPIMRQLLREARASKRSFAEIAADAGVSHRTLYYWEHGTKFPRQTTLESVAGALNLRLERTLRRTNYPLRRSR